MLNYQHNGPGFCANSFSPALAQVWKAVSAGQCCLGFSWRSPASAYILHSCTALLTPRACQNYSLSPSDSSSDSVVPHLLFILRARVRSPIGYHSSGIILLSLDPWYLSTPELTSRLGWLATEPRDPLVSSSKLLRLPAHATSPSFDWA